MDGAGAVEPVECSKSNPNQIWALNMPTKDRRYRLHPFHSSVPSYLNNPSHSSERIKKSMLDPDSREEDASEVGV